MTPVLEEMDAALLPSCAGLVTPGLAGAPIDHLRVLSILATAQRAVELARRALPVASEGHRRSIAAVLDVLESLDPVSGIRAFGSPYATWDAPAGPWALERVDDARPESLRALLLFRHVCGLAGVDLFTVLPPEAFAAGPVRLPWLGVILDADGAVAVGCEDGTTTFTWDDGQRATIPSGGSALLAERAPLVDGRLRAASTWRGHPVEPATPDVAEGFRAFGIAGAAEASRIARGTSDALDLLAEVWPVAADSARRWAGGLLPLLGDRGARSHTSPRLRGVLLTSATDAVEAAEALCHESAHLRLMALLEQDPLLENADEPGHASPWRVDPRPLIGLVLGVHAFIDVCELHRRLELSELSEGSARVLDLQSRRVREGWRLLTELGRPTAIGEKVLAALEEEVARL